MNFNRGLRRRESGCLSDLVQLATERMILDFRDGMTLITDRKCSHTVWCTGRVSTGDECIEAV